VDRLGPPAPFHRLEDKTMTDTQSNVTPITDKQPAPAARFTITAVVDGFPVSIEAEGNAGSLRALVAKLREIGAEPPATVQTPAQPTKPAGVPVCPVRNTQMKVSSAKPGSYFCPKKNEDGSYCKSKA
jgi:hypothetical protein